MDNNPPMEALECCRPSVEKDIAATKPVAIFGLGAIPLKWALHLKSDPPIQDWRGHHFPIKIMGHTCWYFPMFHPAFLLRQGQYAHVFKLDLSNAYKFLDRGIKPEVENILHAQDNIECLYSIPEIKKGLEILRRMPGRKIVDVETPGKKIKPYNTNARILSMAIGVYDYTIAFPWKHRQAKWTSNEFAELHNIIGEFMSDPNIPKGAHNAPFEEEWLTWQFNNKKLPRANWQCTMGKSYCLGYGGRSKSADKDETQRGLLSLDNLCLIHFGFFLKELSNVDRGRLDDEDISDVLLYNGMDSKYTSKLDTELDKQIIEEKLEAINFEHQRRMPTFVLAQLKGLHHSPERAQFHYKRVGATLDSIYRDVSANPSVVEYTARFGSFNPLSHPELINIFEYLGFNLLTHDKEGKPHKSADDEALSKIEHPLAPLIQRLREFDKLKSTYIDPFVVKDGIVYPDGKIHPQYTSLFTTTGRTSARFPNIQNFPARANSEIREIIIAPPGYVLVSSDYGQIEFRGIGMHSKDAKLVKYIWDDHDVHEDWAWKIAKKYPKVVGGLHTLDIPKAFKAFRGKVKNRWVFAAFYGAAYRSLAGYMGIPMDISHELYDEFWDEFSGVKEMQREMFTQYEELGYVESLTGRRRYAYMQGGEIINTPIQGLASDIVIDGMNRLSEYAVETDQDQFQADKNIHDDLQFCLPEETWEKDLKFIIRMMLDCKYSFINVPLSIEAKVGKDMYHLEEYGKFSSNRLEALA